MATRWSRSAGRCRLRGRVSCPFFCDRDEIVGEVRCEGTTSLLQGFGTGMSHAWGICVDGSRKSELPFSLSALYLMSVDDA